MMAPAPSKILPMDSRGRLTIGRFIRHNGIVPAAEWVIDFGPDQSVILTPVRG